MSVEIAKNRLVYAKSKSEMAGNKTAGVVIENSIKLYFCFKQTKVRISLVSFLEMNRNEPTLFTFAVTADLSVEYLILYGQHSADESAATEKWRIYSLTFPT
jgi:hypothetical protein